MSSDNASGPANSQLTRNCPHSSVDSDDRVAVGVVMGLPLNVDGSEGPRAQSVRALAWHIMKRRDVPILFQDERLSTVEAENAMIEADLSRKRRAERIDASAAAVILNDALERLART